MKKTKILLSLFVFNIYGMIAMETSLKKETLHMNEDIEVYVLLIHFFNESYGTVFINNIPVTKRILEDVGSTSKQLEVGSYLTNGTNSIKLLGNFPGYEIALYKTKVNQFPDEGLKIEFKEIKEKEFVFELNDIPHHIWDNTEEIKSTDEKKLIKFALKLDKAIKKGNTKKCLDIKKTQMELYVKELKSRGGNVSYKNLEKDITESLQTIKKGEKYSPIPVSKNEINVHISNSKKLATVTLKNHYHLTAFKRKKDNFIWEWKTYYMKKDGKFIPVF